MIPPTSPVDSSGDESEASHGPCRMWPQAVLDDDEVAPPAPDIREIASPAARHASCPAGGDGEAEQAVACHTLSSRAYQLEMLDQSLKQNVIVVMDTGSGKTQVAVLRIKAELERASPDKIIWFLAPTVLLCAQQLDVLSLQIASCNIKLLTGNDNVDRWTAITWETVLDGARVIVSTYQVLLDALCHAFVRMNRLALIIFDEAHNCVDKHPGCKIMTEFYHRRRGREGDMPSILGLTATPSMRSKIQNIETLEATLDAKCASPTLHREELLRCVKRPQICHVAYGSPSVTQFTESMRSLRNAYLSLDISKDPYILKLRAEPNDRNLRAISRAIEKNDTYSLSQIKGLWSRCVEVCRQLGSWAADLYLWKASRVYLNRLGREGDFFNSWIDEEKRYVADFLRTTAPQRPPSMPQSDCDISDKATVLLQELSSIEESVIGIIFAKERVTVLMLRELLASCPRIAEKYRIGCVVGASNYQGKKRALYEPFGETDQMALQSFRSGAVNLLIATSVLEEGIDIPACNYIMCFDCPDTPKAFIQRRGRARMRDSKLVLLSERSSAVINQWITLEGELKQVYEDEEREVRKLELLEDSEPTSASCFEVESTGAMLDFDNAKQHLSHFCSTLAQQEFVDSRPDYILHQWDTSPPRLSATLLLPSFVPEELRRIEGKYTWLSEKNATKEVAFQAYVALYKAGLVNENLLPHKFDSIAGVESRASVADVEPPFNPWHLVAREWQGQGQKWLYSLTYYDENDVQTDYELLIPVELDFFRPIQLFLDYDKTCQLRFGAGRPVSEEAAAVLPDDTSTLLALPFAHRWPVENRHHVVRVAAKGAEISRGHIGSERFDPTSERIKSGQHLIRDASGTPFVYIGAAPARPPVEQVRHPFIDYDLAPRDEPYLVLKRWTKRSDLLHRPHAGLDTGTTALKRYPWVLPQTWAMVDEIPTKYAQFGMAMPSIIHELEVMLTAKELATTLLRSVDITDLGLVREAISTRASRESVDYERLEFLGDSVLKYCTSAQVAAEHPEWPEGYLSCFRDRLVANARLCRAALEIGLSKFILAKPFTGQKWRPLYLDDYLRQSNKPNHDAKLSTKTLADVVEALIGASYVDGGIPKAVACISTFLRECEWQVVDRGRDRLFHLARSDDALPAVLKPLEERIGYSFRKKALLIEAMTHASCVQNRSFERLEFLGDAVLDYIIVTRLFAVEPHLSHHEMHLCKTAVVNGDFLAFVVLENGLHRSEPVVTEDPRVMHKDTNLALWKFMRHASVSIGLEQHATAERHAALRHEIHAAMERGTSYPWSLLARVQAKKFYSDLFEALLGAVWLDSGSTEACEAILARFGILPYLDRILRDKVHVEHPRQELGRRAVTQTVTYEIDVEASRGAGTRYLCRVLVGERAVAEVSDGVTKEEAMTRAAQQAIKLLTMETEVQVTGPTEPLMHD